MISILDIFKISLYVGTLLFILLRVNSFITNKNRLSDLSGPLKIFDDYGNKVVVFQK